MDQRTNINEPLDIVAHAISITFFKDAYAAELTTNGMTLPQLLDLIKVTKRKTKDDLPWLKGARFGSKCSPKADGTGNSDCLRWDGNVSGFDMIELDYDKELKTFDEAVATIKEMNVRTLIYTTPTHTKAKPRWRLLLPVSMGTLPLEMRGKLCARINGRFGGIFARESFTLSQSYYYGLALDNPAPDHRCEVIDGRFVDHCVDDLFRFEKDGWPAPAGGGTGTGTGTGNANIDWDKVAEHAGWLKNVTDLPLSFNPKGKLIIAHNGNLEDLKFDLIQANLVSKPYQSWSEVSFALTAIFKNDGRYNNEQIAAALLCNLPCNRHIGKQRDQRRTIERLISRSYQQANTAAKKVNPAGTPDWREQRKDGSPLPSMHNARLGIVALDVECSYDTFHSKLLLDSKDESIVGEVTDNAIISLRQSMSDQFGFDLTERFVRDAVVSLALDHRFDPVVNMLAEAEKNWDGVERLNKMAADHMSCEDTPLNSACMRKVMIAAVTRARNPGCKFDTIAVLEGPEGFNKSTAWRVLAGDENFSDESIIGKNSREVQEALAEVWFHESADLAGMRKVEIESVKAFASRTTDHARPAYAHFLKKQKRHSIEVGTTNSSQYLQSQTGNRRFWPMLVIRCIDIEKLTLDRLQLLGEAAHYQSKGESLVLDEKLWPLAGIEQEARRVDDAWEDALSVIQPEVTDVYYKNVNGVPTREEKKVHITFKIDGKECVAAAALYEHILRIPISHQTSATSMRLSQVMKRLGWQRATNGYVTIGGKRVKGYYRDLSAAKV
jgi:predicted P-loop ATPase